MPERPRPDEHLTEARYVFAVAELSRPWREVGMGFGGEPVRTVGRGRRKAVVQTCHSGFLAGAADADALAAAVLEHHRVLQGMLEFAHSLVPCRFGTLVVGNDAAVSCWLKAAAPELRLALERVQGCWEVAVTVGRTAPEPVAAVAAGPTVGLLPCPPSPGKAFLMERLSLEIAEQFRERQAVHLREELMDALAPLMVEWQVESLRGTDMVARFTCLVRHSHLPDFTATLQAAAAARQLTVTHQDVLPPYSFVSLGAAVPGPPRGR